MKYLPILLFVLASCASIKKTQTRTVNTVDSSSTLSTDTARKTTITQQKKDLQIQDFTFDIIYANGDTAPRSISALRLKAFKTHPQAQPDNTVDSELLSALSAFNPDHSEIKEIVGHIGDMRYTDDYTSKADSQGLKTVKAQEVNRVTDTTVKTKSVLRIPVGILIAAGVVVLLIIGIWLFKHGIL